MSKMIKSKKWVDSTVHFVYSKKEHAYEMHIADLIRDLKENQVMITEKECFFEDHHVGYSFVSYINEWFGHNY